jgi:hypothetical protein
MLRGQSALTELHNDHARFPQRDNFQFPGLFNPFPASSRELDLIRFT